MRKTPDVGHWASLEDVAKAAVFAEADLKRANLLSSGDKKQGSKLPNGKPENQPEGRAPEGAGRKGPDRLLRRARSGCR